MTLTTHNKRIVIIAGPNGAGKTTFAREFLPTDAEGSVALTHASAIQLN